MKNLKFSAILWLIMTSSSQATVQPIDCGDGSSDFGTSCSLQELLDGGSIVIDNVWFQEFEWTSQVNAGSLGPLSAIRVDGVDSRARPALVFADTGTTWNRPGPTDTLNTLRFRILDQANSMIGDRRLYAEFGDISGFDQAQLQDSKVFIKDSAFKPLEQNPKFEAVVQCFASEVQTLGQSCANRTRRDSHTGAPLFTVPFLSNNDLIAEMEFDIKAEATGHAQIKRLIYQAVLSNPVKGAVVPDLTGNGVPEVAVLDENQSLTATQSILAEVRDGLGGPVLAQRAFLGMFDTTISMVVLPDLDGNGVPELAVLAIHLNGVGTIEIRNVTGPSLPRRIAVASGHYPRLMRLLNGDSDHNGVPELAVLSFRNSDNRAKIEVFNAFGPLNRQTLVYDAAKFVVLDFASVDDGNADGAPEIAALLQRISDLRCVVEIRNVGGPPLNETRLLRIDRATITGSGRTGITPVADANGNGIPELAVLERDPVSGAKSVEVFDEFGNANKRFLNYPGGMAVRPLGVLGIPDTDGDGVPEIAVMADQRLTARTTLYIDEGDGTSDRRTIEFTPGTQSTAIGFAFLGDADGNGSPEVVAFLSDNDDGRLAAESRNVTGPPLERVLYFRP